MGHVFFVLLHFLALLFGAILLLVTIPLHLIYGAIRRNRSRGPSPRTHVICPECRELVLKDARVCKHCGSRLKPSTS